MVTLSNFRLKPLETQVDLAKAEAKRPRFKGLSDYESTAYSGNSYYFGKNQVIMDLKNQSMDVNNVYNLLIITTLHNSVV